MPLLQGKFKPKNPGKYRGDPSNIYYRSSWEARCMLKFDSESNVLWWSSEEIIVPYRSPVDGKLHRYFPDFVIRVKNAQGIEETLMIEVKPAKETKEPIKKSKVTKQYLNEVFTWGKNKAKWKAAEEYALDRGWEFRVMTEEHLGL